MHYGLNLPCLLVLGSGTQADNWTESVFQHMDCSDKADDFEVFQLYTAILAALDYTAAATVHNPPAVVAVHMTLAVV